MRTLVTGASGFLGGRLAQILACRGEEVTVLARARADLRHLDGYPIRVARGALSDRAALQDAVRDRTHVFHCAAHSSDWGPRAVFEEANVAGVANLLSAARRVRGLERFVHVSTTDVYGYPRVPCEESHPAVDSGLPYNSTKCAGEALVWAAWRDGLPVTVIRPATIYGPRSKDFAVEIAKHIRAGSMLVIDGGRAPGGFAYVDTVAEAMIAAAASPETMGRAYNIADGTGATWRAYVDKLAGGLGLRRPWLNLPLRVALPLARAMEKVHGALRLPGRPLLTSHAVLLFARNQEYPTAAALRDFGFAPAIGFEEGVASHGGMAEKPDPVTTLPIEPVSATPPHRTAHPLMRQSWRELTFLHWPYEPSAVRSLVPAALELDLYDGAAWVGLVPFIVADLTLPRAPALPWASTFPETNVRTYVVDRLGRRGVWFFSLDAARLHAVVGARTAYALPYFWARMKVRREGNSVRYTSRRLFGPAARSDISILTGDPIPNQSELEVFLTARFRLYAARFGRLLKADVEHAPWPLQCATVERLDQNLIQAAGLPSPAGEPLAHFSRRIDVMVAAVSLV